MQVKLHHWVVSEPDRRFDNVVNLVHHPDFLTVALGTGAGKQRCLGCRSGPGQPWVSPATIAEDDQVEEFLGHVPYLCSAAGAGAVDPEAE